MYRKKKTCVQRQKLPTAIMAICSIIDVKATTMLGTASFGQYSRCCCPSDLAIPSQKSRRPRSRRNIGRNSARTRSFQFNASYKPSLMILTHHVMLVMRTGRCYALNWDTCNIHTHIHTDTYVHSYIHTYIHAYIHTDTHIHTYMHRYIHACMYA